MVVLLRIVHVRITEELKYSLKMQEGIDWLIKWETPDAGLPSGMN